MAAVVAAGITVLLWASAFVGIRAAGRTFGPGELSFGRLLVATVALALLAVVRGERWPARIPWRPLLLCGLLWFAAYNIVLTAGEKRVDAGTAAMLVNLGPVLIAILAGLLLREGFPPMLFVGCAVAFGGVVVIGLASSRHTTTTTGVVLCVTAAFAYAAGAVTQKIVLRSLSGMQTIFFCCAIGAVACLPFAPRLVHQLRGASAGSIAWLVYIAIGPMALGFLTWAYALRRWDAGRLAATTYLVPPLSVLLGWLWLGETPATLAYLGGALCLVGVAISRRTSARGRSVPAAAESGSRP
jgi:drug/metabolite transporter (DMT)-like permease